MQITFDPGKSERNRRERNLPFERAAEFEFSTASIHVDLRHDYGEARYIAVGRLDGRLHVLCFTETAEGIRVISLRKANEREVKRHAKVQAHD
nr:BrnT family toxin [uncultured Roseateles sp.]